MTPITSLPASRPSPRQRWLAAGREIVFVLAMFGLYFQVRRFTSADEGSAFANAGHVVRWERATGIFRELGVQRFALDRRWLIEVLDHYYVLAHFPITCVLLVWAFLKVHHVYRWIRNWFLIVTGCGLLIHLLFPLAPPRLLDASFGFTDTLDRFGPDIYTSDIKSSTANQLAAMPSLHFAWALLVAIIVVRLWRSRLAWLAFVHPFMTLFAIVGTGNHYFLDAIVGAVLVGIALVLRPLRARRETAPATHEPVGGEEPDDDVELELAEPIDRAS